MRLSIVREYVVVPALAGLLLAPAASAAESEGQAVIDTLRAGDPDDRNPTGVSSLKAGNGACLAQGGDLAKMSGIQMLLAQQSHGFLRPAPDEFDRTGDFQRILAGQGRVLEIDRSQFGMPPDGEECQVTRYITDPVEIDGRAYVEIGYGKCRSLCGGGTLFALRKEGDRWVNDGMVIHWAS